MCLHPHMIKFFVFVFLKKKKGEKSVKPIKTTVILNGVATSLIYVLFCSQSMSSFTTGPYLKNVLKGLLGQSSNLLINKYSISPVIWLSKHVLSGSACF